MAEVVEPHARASDQIKSMFGIEINKFDLHTAMNASGLQIVKKPFNPPLDFDLGGECLTGEIRVRTGWLGFAVIEEKIAYRDGTSGWRRRPGWHGPVYLAGARAWVSQ